MKIVKKRCKFCHKWFLPDQRTYRIQKCCSNPDCRKNRMARALKNWRNNYPGYDSYRRAKIRRWAKEYPDYWQKYRREHTDYVKKDNKRRSNRYKKEKNSAKQNAIDCRVDGILNYLFWKESSAKQNHMDRQV